MADDLFSLRQSEGNIFLLSTGSQSGWTNEELAGDNMCEGEIVAIPWGGTPNVKYYNGKFVTGDNRIATSNDKKLLSNKYLYYWLQNNIKLLNTFYRGAGIQHPNMKSVLTMKIPVPPLPVQQEIVRILDSFSELEKELEKELEAREKQYECYRNQLLSFGEGGDHACDVKWMKLGEVVKKISSGGTPNTKKQEYYNGTIPWLRTQEVDFGEIYTTGVYITEEGLKNSSAKWIPANCVIMAMYGATVGKVAVNRIPLTTNQACCNLECDSNRLHYKFLYYFLCDRYKYIKSLGQGSQTNINANIVKNLQIPLPPLAEQKRIVEILDKFDALVNDISIGLPAEINARRKQYEYYREKLLTFPRKVSE